MPHGGIASPVTVSFTCRTFRLLSASQCASAMLYMCKPGVFLNRMIGIYPNSDFEATALEEEEEVCESNGTPKFEVKVVHGATPVCSKIGPKSQGTVTKLICYQAALVEQS